MPITIYILLGIVVTSMSMYGCYELYFVVYDLIFDEEIVIDLNKEMDINSKEGIIIVREDPLKI